MREGHLRERQLAIGSLVYGIGEAIRAANDKYQTLDACRHTALQHIGKLDGTKLGTMLIEEHEMVGIGYQLQYLLTLQAFLLGLRQLACVALPKYEEIV